MIDDTVAEIEAMQTHSSSVVAVKAARSLSELLDREYASVEEFERDLEHNAGALRRANPSHASLYSAVRNIERAVLGEATSVEEAKEVARAAIDRTVEQIDAGKREAAAQAAETFVDGETFITHDYSSTVLEAVESAARNGTHLTAYVMEARPRFLGRKTARTLAGVDRVEPHLFVDSAMGHALRECDRVVVGMTSIVGDTYYNRIGTLPLAATAKVLGIPMDVVGSSTKIIDDGFVFENEFRPPSEVMLEPVAGIELENPAYDEVPVDLVNRVITDDGIVEF